MIFGIQKPQIKVLRKIFSSGSRIISMPAFLISRLLMASLENTLMEPEDRLILDAFVEANEDPAAKAEREKLKRIEDLASRGLLYFESLLG